jgi:hypothetical protein
MVIYLSAEMTQIVIMLEIVDGIWNHQNTYLDVQKMMSQHTCIGKKVSINNLIIELGTTL